jgi:hypothetical protein
MGLVRERSLVASALIALAGLLAGLVGVAIGTSVAGAQTTEENSNYVHQLYLDLHGDVDPDPDAVQAFVDDLEDGGSRSAVASALVDTDAYRALTVDRIFRDLLDRAPDPDGLLFWVGQLRAGQTQQVVKASIIASDEYFSNSGDNEAFVTAVYNDLLGRDPDAAGLEFWVDRLEAGDPRFVVAGAFIFTTEALGVQVDEQYRLYLRRDADAGGRDFWVQFLQGGARIEQLAISLVSSEEYFAQAQAIQSHRPDAVDDSAQTVEDHGVVIDVLANDTDPDDDLDPGSLAVTDGPANGTATVEGTSIRYSPTADFNGEDTFRYHVCDSSDPGPLCDGAIVHVFVAPRPDGSVDAQHDDATVAAGGSVDIDVLANDSSHHGTLDPASVTVTEAPAHGTTAVDGSDGSITYTPNAGFAGTDTFRYQVCDVDAAGNGCDDATVTVNVANAPVANDDSATTSANRSVAIDVLANDSDADGDLEGSTLAVTSPPSHGFTTIASETNQIIYTPESNFTGDDSFVYEVCDGSGLCDDATVAVTVTAAVRRR